MCLYTIVLIVCWDVQAITCSRMMIKANTCHISTWEQARSNHQGSRTRESTTWSRRVKEVVKQSQRSTRVRSQPKSKPGQHKSNSRPIKDWSPCGSSRSITECTSVKVKDRPRKSTVYKLDQDKKKSRSEAHGWTYTVDCQGVKTPRQTLMAYLSATVKSARVANGRPPGAEDPPLIVQVLTSKKDKGTRVASHVRTSTSREMKTQFKIGDQKVAGGLTRSTVGRPPLSAEVVFKHTIKGVEGFLLKTTPLWN